MPGPGACALPRHFTIHNAVDTIAVRDLVHSEGSLALKRLYCQPGRVIFGYIGRLSREKGVDVLFDAFSLLSVRYAGICLLVVGDGPEKQALEVLCRDEEWGNRVFFTGKLTWQQAMQHLAIMDVVVVPSRFEGFGLSAVEAMAASKPVIAAKAGGLSEIMTHGYDGLLFENSNSRELASMMEEVFLDPAKREKLSWHAVKRASDFGVMPFEQKIRNLYTTEA
ncbi:MAG: glycosyltransferase family 4 protein [Chlorobiaceae bacterium]|nr:glycosyltransferase family 4 protein [Chlorobiaceae bacterium]